jgi:hypothetical protein
MRGLKWRYKLPIITAIVVTVILLLWFIFLIRDVTVEGNTFFPAEKVAESYQEHFWQKNILTNLLMDALGFTEDLSLSVRYPDGRTEDLIAGDVSLRL